MLVFKFGGASVKDAQGVRAMADILRRYPEAPILVVVSAMAKTTNALETLTRAYFDGSDRRFALLRDIRYFHQGVAEELFPDESHPVFTRLSELSGALEAYLSSEAGGNYDYEYDQIVSYGELFSTVIVSHYLEASGISNTFFDARDLIITDNTYREGRVNWEKTEKAVHEVLNEFFSAPLFQKIAVTQGFIGRSSDGATTTLAREGSDYTAAIFAYCLDASEVIIWKEVAGLLNADPNAFSGAKLIPRISYAEALELAYYGASVLHPNTIKPLQNKKIPLRIKSFRDPEADGTLISPDTETGEIIPSYIFRENQILASIQARDFSYIEEQSLHQIFGIFASLAIRINMMQNSAISFSVCFDDPGEKKESLLQALNAAYKVKYNDGLRLITIRNYRQDVVDEVVGDAEVMLEQKSRYTLQVVVRK